MMKGLNSLIDGDLSWGELIAIWVCVFAMILAFASAKTAEGQYRDVIPGDEQLTKAIIGVWKEIYHQNCIDGESIVIYYPNMRFEEFTTYIANEDCKFNNNGKVLKTGESNHEVNTGTWKVSGGHIYYKELIGDHISSMRIISINAQRASLTWDNGNTCEGYRIDLHGK